MTSAHPHCAVFSSRLLASCLTLLMILLPASGFCQGAVLEDGGVSNESPELSCRNFNWGVCTQSCQKANDETGGRGCTSMCSRKQSDCSRALNNKQKPSSTQPSQMPRSPEQRDQYLSRCATNSARCEDNCDSTTIQTNQSWEWHGRCKKNCEIGFQNCQAKAF